MKLTRDKIQKAIPAMFWILNQSRGFVPDLALIIGMGVLGSLSGVAIAIASKNMVDAAVRGDLRMAGIAAAAFGGVLLLNLSMNVMSSLVATRVSESMSNAIRQHLFKDMLGTQWLPLSSYHSGDLLTRLTSDVGSVTSCLVNVIPSILYLGVQFTAAFFTLLHYEPKLAYLAFILGPATLLFSRVWGRKIKQLNLNVKESESIYRSYLQEALQNFLIIKSFRLEDYSRDTLQGFHENRMSWVLKLNRTTLTASTILGGGFMSGYFIAFVWGTYRLSQNAITFGTLTAFLQLVSQVQGPFIGLARTLPQIISATASAGRIMELEAMEKEQLTENIPVPKAVGISFRNAAFAYHEDQPVLKNVSIEIQPGEIVALMGTSGEGKTTIIRILLALLRPDAGEVFLSNEREQDFQVSAATRDWITYVPQGNTLFSGTIADNLRYGKPDANLEEMEQAARDACAWGFIRKLPQGLETKIGEQGLGLSEGQAQRIAIARALLKKAPVLILDEATSALDVQSEMHVLDAIKNLSYTCTCLVITHRPSVRRICSRVLQLQDGVLTLDKV